MLNNIENNKRIAKNTLILSFRMFITTGLSIYSSRIILHALGVIDYGIYNVVGSIISMLSFLNSSMITSTQRHIAYYIGKNDKERIKEVFTSSINLHIVLTLFVIFLAETIGLYFLNNNLDIPNNRLAAANVIYQLTIINAIFNILSIPYKALIVSYERLNIYAYTAIFQSIATLIISFFLLYTTTDKLILYALLLTILSIIIRAFEKYYCNHKLSYHYQRKNNNYSNSYKELLTFSGWNALVSCAHFAYTQGSIFLLNIFCGPASNAAQALANQVNLSLMTFNSNFTLAIKPQIIKSYANNNDYFSFLVKNCIKVSFLIMSIVALPFIIRTDYIISIWLTEVPMYTSEFLKLALILSIIISFADPITTAIYATGNIKKYQIAEFIALICILPFTYIILRKTTIAYSIYYVRIIIFTLFMFVRLFFLNKQLGFNLTQFIKMIIKISSSMLISYIILLIINIFLPYNILGFILLCFLSLIINISFSYLIAFNFKEKKQLRNTLNIFIKNER